MKTFLVVTLALIAIPAYPNQSLERCSPPPVECEGPSPDWPESLATMKEKLDIIEGGVARGLNKLRLCASQLRGGSQLKAYMSGMATMETSTVDITHCLQLTDIAARRGIGLWLSCDFNVGLKPCYEVGSCPDDLDKNDRPLAFYFSVGYKGVSGFHNKAAAYSGDYDTRQILYERSGSRPPIRLSTQEFVLRIDFFPHIFNSRELCIHNEALGSRGRWARNAREAAEYVFLHEFAHLERYFWDHYSPGPSGEESFREPVGPTEDDAWNYASTAIRCSVD